MTVQQLSVFIENKAGTLLKVLELLKEAKIQLIASTIADTLDNQVGRAADAIKIFSDAKIGITYMYSFLLGDKGILIFRTDNPDRAREVIILNNLSFVADKDLSSLI